VEQGDQFAMGQPHAGDDLVQPAEGAADLLVRARMAHCREPQAGQGLGLHVHR
jgi:hypothetical protein